MLLEERVANASTGKRKFCAVPSVKGKAAFDCMQHFVIDYRSIRYII